jgi:tricarballylate dehydrogenase
MAYVAFDVIVVGGGNAGLCAALAAREEGASVLLLERSPRWRRGGNSRHTRDIRYVHEESERWASKAYPRSEFLADLAAVTDMEQPHLIDVLLDESRSLPSWMERHGVRWQDPIKGTLHLQTNRFFLGGGRTLVNAYYDKAAGLGVDIRYEADVVALTPRSDRCDVEFAYEEKHETASARAVVIAAGGIEANYDYLEETCGPGGRNFVVRGTPDNDGAMLLKLRDLGAATCGTDLFHCVAVDARAPQYDGGIVTRVDSIPFGVVLNKHGVRFYDEGEDAWPKRYAVWGQLIGRQPDQIAFSIFDSASHGLFIPPAYPPIQSQSLEGLLAELDLDVEAALATIAGFNAAIDDTRRFDPAQPDGRATAGTDPPRRNWARAIARPPFSAYPLRPGVTFTYTGVAIDETARVLRDDGRPFPNVFAAGEIMAGNILTRGYLAGVGLTIGSVFGRVAGREAAHA